ncbi:hypothetical protein Ddc_11216 [Ditylenchus destructor]|nr:hypothetical protein Ddc_11216 [Ditylenchus destructor]
MANNPDNIICSTLSQLFPDGIKNEPGTSKATANYLNLDQLFPSNIFSEREKFSSTPRAREPRPLVQLRKYTSFLPKHSEIENEKLKRLAEASNRQDEQLAQAYKAKRKEQENALFDEDPEIDNEKPLVQLRRYAKYASLHRPKHSETESERKSGPCFIRREQISRTERIETVPRKKMEQILQRETGIRFYSIARKLPTRRSERIRNKELARTSMNFNHQLLASNSQEKQTPDRREVNPPTTGIQSARRHRYKTLKYPIMKLHIRAENDKMFPEASRKPIQGDADSDGLFTEADRQVIRNSSGIFAMSQSIILNGIQNSLRKTAPTQFSNGMTNVSGCSNSSSTIVNLDDIPNKLRKCAPEPSSNGPENVPECSNSRPVRVNLDEIFTETNDVMATWRKQLCVKEEPAVEASEVVDDSITINHPCLIDFQIYKEDEATTAYRAKDAERKRKSRSRMVDEKTPVPEDNLSERVNENSGAVPENIKVEPENLDEMIPAQLAQVSKENAIKVEIKEEPPEESSEETTTKLFTENMDVGAETTPVNYVAIEHDYH